MHDDKINSEVLCRKKNSFPAGGFMSSLPVLDDLLFLKDSMEQEPLHRTISFMKILGSGTDCIKTFEPTDSPAGKLVRSILKGEIKVKPKPLPAFFS